MTFPNWLRRLVSWDFSKDHKNVSTHHSIIEADVPIRSASQDLLRRTQFAERIADVLSAGGVSDGRVFAIRGNWGYGKSSLKNLIIEVLRARSAVQWLEFNPWQWGDDATIARALFTQIAVKLGGDRTPEAEERAKAMRRYGAILVGAGGKLRGAGGDNGITAWFTYFAIAAAGFGIALPASPLKYVAAGALILSGIVLSVGHLLNYLGRDRSSSLEDARVDIEARLRKASQSLVVFVDDIDRLEPEQIRMLFRHVKVNANLPNLVFVLLFQPSIVEEALRPVAGTEGRQFLEKIVQANFDLPALAPSRVHGIFTEQLSGIASSLATPENGFEQVRWGNALIGCIQPYIRNLRDARRLLSSIAIHLPLHEGQSAFEVNVVDFLGLEALRVFEPDLHVAIFNNRDLLLQKNRFSGDNQKDVDRERIDAVLSVVPENRRGLARDALKELFPPISWAFDNMNFGSSWQTKWIGQKRVCTDRFFDRYFEFHAPEGEITESEFVDFLNSSSNAEALRAATEALASRELLPSLATRLDESVERLPREDASILLPEMFRIGDKLAGARISDPFYSPWVSAWRAVSWYLKGIPEDERVNLVLGAFKITQALPVAAILISLDMDSRKEGSDRDVLFDDAGLKKLKGAWVECVKAMSKDDGTLLSHSDLVSMLYRWRDFSGSIRAPRSWVRRIAKNDDQVGALISALMSVGTSHSSGDRVGRRYEYFQRQTIDDFLGITAIQSRLKDIDPSMLTDDQAKAVDVLREHVAVWTGEKPAPLGFHH